MSTMSISNWKMMTMSDLVTLKDKMVHSHTCSSGYQRLLVYLGMVLADRLIVEGDLERGEEELEMCAALIHREGEGGEEEQKVLLHDLRTVKFLQFEVAVLRSQFDWGSDLRLQLSPLADCDSFHYYSFLCYSAGAELFRLGRQGEARDWLRSVPMVDRVYKITGIRDARVKLLIKMAVKDEVEEADDGRDAVLSP